jgi:hypothetical protein
MTTLTTTVIDVVSGQPISGADVSICRFLDPTCGAPLTSGRSDSAGTVALPVTSSGFNTLAADSFAQVTSSSIVPTLYFLGYPVSEPQAPIAQPYVLTVSPNAIPTFFAPETWDMTLGWVQFGVFDCYGLGAAGAKVTIDSTDPRIRPFYFQTLGSSLVPSFTATSTDKSGYGGFLNVPPGTVTLTADPMGLGKPSSHAHVLVRPGTFSQYFMFPTP